MENALEIKPNVAIWYGYSSLWAQFLDEHNTVNPLYIILTKR
jgi:hypothetical protein